MINIFIGTGASVFSRVMISSQIKSHFVDNIIRDRERCLKKVREYFASLFPEGIEDLESERVTMEMILATAVSLIREDLTQINGIIRIN